MVIGDNSVVIIVIGDFIHPKVIQDVVTFFFYSKKVKEDFYLRCESTEVGFERLYLKVYFGLKPPVG